MQVVMIDPNAHDAAGPWPCVV